MIESDTFVRKYTSALQSEAEMFDDVNCFLEKHHLKGRMAHVFRLCVSEAFTNALEHGNKFAPDKSVSITLHVNGETLSADITDEGSGGLAEIQRRSQAQSFDEGGRGVDLIYRHAGKTEVSETADGGIRVHMSFARDAFCSQEEEKAN